jgi:hypothetical protein
LTVCINIELLELDYGFVDKYAIGS